MNRGVGRAGSATALLLLAACGPSGCDETTQGIKVYSTMAECQADVDDQGARRHADEDCSKAFGDAQQEHARSAPRYSTSLTCEEKHGAGNCVPRHESGGDVFVPLMAGFLLGHALGSSPSVVSQPVYVDRTGSAYAGASRLGSYCNPASSSGCGGGGKSGFGYVYGGGGSSGGVWSSGSYATQNVTKPPAPSSAVSRGGFGGSASSVTMPSASAPSVATAPSSGVARGGFGGTAATSAASAGE